LILALSGSVVIIITVALAVIRPWEKKRHPCASSPISTLRTLSSVQAQYVTTYDTYADLATLCNAGLIDSVLGTGIKSGYRFEVVFNGNSNWYCISRPVEWQEGYRNFIMITDGVIYFNREKDSNEYPNVLGGG
jgi:hypothetical protein